MVVEGDGIVVTNAGLSWLSHDRLPVKRSDVIHVQLLGRGDSSTGMDYTVNASAGFPLVTGLANHCGPINHVLPAWDVCCGLYAALATAGNLGFLTEPQVNGTQRPRLGNAIYGQYGRDFASRDGAAFMVVALTGRHFRDLVEVTGTGAAVAVGRHLCRNRRRADGSPQPRVSSGHQYCGGLAEACPADVTDYPLRT